MERWKENPHLRKLEKGYYNQQLFEKKKINEDISPHF
jgi:hypothetical protein